MNRIKELFRSDSKYRPMLLSILITGLGYGLYKGMLDNFLAEVVQQRVCTDDQTSKGTT